MIRVEQEQDGTFNEGIELEDGTVVSDNTIVEGIQLEDEQEVETQEDDNIILDGTEVVTPDATTICRNAPVVPVSMYDADFVTPVVYSVPLP